MLKKYIINNFNQEINYNSEISLIKSLGNILYKNIIFFNFNHKATELNDEYYLDPLCFKYSYEKKYIHTCQGFQILFLHLLKAFSLNAIPVSMHTDSIYFQIKDDVKEYRTHCIIEINNIAYDPTFNTFFKLDKQYLSSYELCKIINNNQFDKVILNNDCNEKQTILNYPVPYKLFKNIYCNNNKHLEIHKKIIYKDKRNWDWEKLYTTHPIYKQFF